jgi:hypothetical protein
MAKRTPQRKQTTREEPPAVTDTDTTTATDFNPFLKPEHLKAGVNTFVRTGWTRRTRGKFGPQIIVEVHDERENAYDFAVTEGSPNHRELFKALGANPQEWGAGVLKIECKTSRQQRPFLSIVEATAGTDGAPF